MTTAPARRKTERSPPPAIRLFEFTLPEEPQQDGLLALTPPTAASPPPPVDASWQDVLFDAPPLPGPASGEPVAPVVIAFVMADPNVGLDMRRRVHDIYAIHGQRGLDHLHEALLGRPGADWRFRGEPYLAREQGLPGELAGGVPDWTLPEGDGNGASGGVNEPVRAPQRWRLIEAWQLETRWLAERIEEVTRSVARRARQRGLERIAAARRQILAESAHYLAMAHPSDATHTAALDSGVRRLPFNSNGLLQLARAVLRITSAQHRIDELVREHARLATPRSPNQRPLEPWIPAPGRAMTADVRALIEDTDIHRASAQRWQTGVADSFEQGVAEATSVIAAELRSCPAAHRVALELDEIEPLRAIVDSDATDAAKHEALAAHGRLREALLTVLRRAWQASQRMQRALADEDFAIWRYPSLVTDALARLGIPRGSIEWQAVAERTEREAGETDLVSTLSDTAGVVELGLLAAGATPHSLLAAAVVGVLLQTADWLADLWRVEQQRDAFDCALDPSLSFAAKPSYTWLLVSLVLVALQVRGAAQAGQAATRVLR